MYKTPLFRHNLGVCRTCTTYGCGAEQRGPRPGSLSGITSDTLFILLHAAVADNDKGREGGVKMQPKGASVSPSLIFCQVSKTDKFLSLTERQFDLSKDLNVVLY